MVFLVVFRFFVSKSEVSIFSKNLIWIILRGDVAPHLSYCGARAPAAPKVESAETCGWIA